MSVSDLHAPVSNVRFGSKADGLNGLLLFDLILELPQNLLA